MDGRIQDVFAAQQARVAERRVTQGLAARRAALALARLLCDADDVLRETERLNRWCADRMEAALAARGQR